MTDGDRRENALARILVQSSVDGLCTIDREYRYTLWNPAMERFAGKRADEVLGRHIFEVFPFLRDLGLDKSIERAFAGETVTGEAYPMVIPSGEVHYFDRHYLPLRDDQGAVVGMIGIVRDVTARHDAEEALRASDEKLRMAVEASGIGLWSWDLKTDRATWEPALCAIAGIPRGTAPPSRDAYLALIHPDDRDRAAASIARGIAAGEWEGEHRLVRPDGQVRWVLTKAAISQREGHMVARGAVVDVTERHQHDEQLRQAQKLEAVGMLTAGISHNFNNLLMAILANLELAEAAPPNVQPFLASAREAGMRAADLVRQLMTFAGGRRPAARNVESIGSLVERTVAFCRTTFDKRISIDGTYDLGARATVDPVQIEQALLNVLINARDAVAGVAEPRVTLAVDVVQAGAPELGGREGDYVRIRISDNGVGMSASTLSRIYEPFFTTKDVGSGTGLGLATAHAIIREHGGFMTCSSEARKGASFAIYLERAEGAEPVASPGCAPMAATGTETILVVDDEAPIRTVVAMILSSAGYTAKLAASGQEAIDRMSNAAEAKQVALVLLDVSMPGIAGHALRRRLRELAPQVPVVYFTGHAFEALEAIDPDDEVLQKPANADQLLGTLREVLGRRR